MMLASACVVYFFWVLVGINCMKLDFNSWQKLFQVTMNEPRITLVRPTLYDGTELINLRGLLVASEQVYGMGRSLTKLCLIRHIPSRL